MKDEDALNKADHTGSLSGIGPGEQPQEEELALGGGLQQQLPGGSGDGDSHTTKPEVRAAA